MATPLTSLVIFFMFFFLLDSIAYTFGELGGVISFVFAEDERPNTRNDQLTMGFTTTQLDGLLLRVASAYLNDFIEVELVRDIGHTPPSGYGFHLIRDTHGTHLSMVSTDRAEINRRLCFGKPKPTIQENWPSSSSFLRKLRVNPSKNLVWSGISRVLPSGKCVPVLFPQVVFLPWEISSNTHIWRNNFRIVPENDRETSLQGTLFTDVRPTKVSICIKIN